MTILENQSLIQLHKVLLMIAKDFHEFCEENGITYYLMGGTALGAMRHQGFIPWDDDFDVFMDSENYEKFLNAAPSKLNTEKYYVQKENTEEWPLFFSKVRLNGSQYDEAENLGREMHTGIFIDVMCLMPTYRNAILRRMQFFGARFLSAYGLNKRGYQTDSVLKKIGLGISSILHFKIVRKLLLSAVRPSKKRPQLVGHFFGRAPFRATTFPHDFLGKPRMTKFENLELPVPERVEEYLTVRFGDKYMELPSKATRDKFPPHAISFSAGRWAE